MAKRKLPPGVSYRGKTKDGQPKHQGKVRQLGHNLNQLFIGPESDLEAGRWVVETKAAIRGGTFKDLAKERETRLVDLFDKYEKEVSPKKAAHKQERSMFNLLRQEAWAQLPVLSVRTKHLAEYRTRREEEGRAPSTINNAINLVSAVYRHAISEWDYDLDNPVSGVKRVRQNNGRGVKFAMAELTGFLAECEEEKSGYWWLKYVIRLQLLTAMRQGEVRRLHWDDLKKTRTGYAWHLPKTKNGEERDVPLLPEAEAVMLELKEVAPKNNSGWVFGDPDMPASEGGFSMNLVTLAHRNAAIRSGFRDATDDEEGDDENADEATVELKGRMTNHDLRHIACTMLSKFYPNALALSRVTGHKTLSVLRRYYNVSTEELVSELHLGQRNRLRMEAEDRKAREQKAAEEERLHLENEALKKQVLALGQQGLRIKTLFDTLQKNGAGQSSRPKLTVVGETPHDPHAEPDLTAEDIALMEEHFEAMDRLARGDLSDVLPDDDDRTYGDE